MSNVYEANRPQNTPPPPMNVLPPGVGAAGPPPPDRAPPQAVAPQQAAAPPQDAAPLPLGNHQAAPLPPGMLAQVADLRLPGPGGAMGPGVPVASGGVGPAVVHGN